MKESTGVVNRNANAAVGEKMTYVQHSAVRKDVQQ
jgi:hypothetical protein